MRRRELIEAPSPRCAGCAFPAAEAAARAAFFGLFDARAFLLTTGAAAPGLPPAARFYFENETIAVPHPAPSVRLPAYVPGLDAWTDLARWAAAVSSLRRATFGIAAAPPPLVWAAFTQSCDGVALCPEGTAFEYRQRRHPLELAPRLPSNPAFFNAASARFLSQRPIRLGGDWRDGVFIARSFCPRDFRFDAGSPLHPLPATSSTVAALRAAMRDSTGSAPSSRLLWRRSSESGDTENAPAILLTLQGAQSDDDESWGGHFAIATGRLGADGDLADLLVNNFYSPDAFSEKGILPAPTPLDAYFADVNSGQAWYRPSHALLIVLDRPDAARFVQGAMNRLFLQLWRHRLRFCPARMNCAGIGIDALRTLGWPLPSRPCLSPAVAALCSAGSLIARRSFIDARRTFEYLTEDPVRLFPAAAFEEAAVSLLDFVHRTPQESLPADAGLLARLLAADTRAVALLHLPQIPSPRAAGSAAVVSVSEYGRVLRERRHCLKVYPLPPRPFPESLYDDDIR